MKNLMNEKPTDPLRPRQIESLRFVSESDIKNKEILDVGCGYGWFESYALSKGVKRICGIEIAESDFAKAVEGIKDKRAEFKIGSAIKIPYKDKQFDTVVCWEVIEHIPKGTEIDMFREVGRVLKDGGTFYLSTPYNSFLSKYLDPAWWILGHRHYSEAKLRQTGNSGLKAERVMKKGKIWSLFLLLNFYASKWVLRRTALFDEHFISKEKAEYKKKKGFMQIFVQYAKYKNRLP